MAIVSSMPDGESAVELPFILGGWKSIRPGRVAWSEEDVARQAVMIRSCLPPTLLSMIDEGSWPGDGLMILSSNVARPTAAELAQNHCFLKPLVMESPRKVPSAFFIADSFLYLDLLLNKRLFKPQPAANGKQAVSRMDLAAREGVKGKRLYGALRFLWRSSPFGGHDPRIVDLKQYIQASPRKPAIEDDEASSSHPEMAPSPGDDDDEDDDGSEEGGESLAVAEINNESGSDDDDSVGDEVGGPITDGLSSEGSSDEHDGHDGKGDEITPAKTEYDGVSVSESDPEDAQSKIQRQRTLELGECASDSEDMRDSQVSSGWLGKAYNHASREAKEQATKQKAIEALAKELIESLVASDGNLRDDPFFYCYFDYCVETMTKFGEQVATKLATKKHFRLWTSYCKHQKEQESTSPPSSSTVPAKAMDPVNRARSLMQMPVEPVLEGGDEEADGSAEMPPAKRPKSGRVVQRAIVVESLGVVPPQTVAKTRAAADPGAVTSQFKGYNLNELKVPIEAWPLEGFPYKGSKSYTVRSRSGAAIEVLLANRAFVVKRVGLISGQDDSGAPPADRKSGQVTWSKYKTTGAAWEIAKQRANFV